MKRFLDIVASALGLLVLSPVLGVVLFRIWLQDGHSPFYLGERAARGGGRFLMVKIRSMIENADSTGVESTGAADNRITPFGHFIRRWKLDEIPQLWNVLKGDMSLVGPRPNTLREVAKYSSTEVRLLSVRPGITDIASIVFSDEGEILRDAANPDEAYEHLIRPWKSRLGILYAENANIILDLRLIYLTVLAIADRRRALIGVQSILRDLRASDDLKFVARREHALEPPIAVL